MSIADDDATNAIVNTAMIRAGIHAAKGIKQPAAEQDINTQLAHALGVHDLHGVTRIELVLDAGKLPMVKVHRYAHEGADASLVDRVVTTLNLKLIPEGDAA